MITERQSKGTDWQTEKQRERLRKRSKDEAETELYESLGTREVEKKIYRIARA